MRYPARGRPSRNRWPRRGGRAEASAWRDGGGWVGRISAWAAPPPTIAHRPDKKTWRLHTAAAEAAGGRRGRQRSERERRRTEIVRRSEGDASTPAAAPHAASALPGPGSVPFAIRHLAALAELRSEERRVGKECRCGGAPDP